MRLMKTLQCYMCCNAHGILSLYLLVPFPLCIIPPHTAVLYLKVVNPHKGFLSCEANELGNFGPSEVDAQPFGKKGKM